MARHIIWQDTAFMSLSDIEDWTQEILAEYPMLSEDEAYQQVQQTNTDYMYDECANMNVQLPENILVLGDIGTWRGNRHGYRELGNNLNDAFKLAFDTDYFELYVTDKGELKARGAHHDGTNYYTIRMWKPGLTDRQKETYLNKIFNGTDTAADMTYYTVRLGDIVGDVYGWTFKGRRPKVA